MTQGGVKRVARGQRMRVALASAGLFVLLLALLRPPVSPAAAQQSETDTPFPSETLPADTATDPPFEESPTPTASEITASDTPSLTPSLTMTLEASATSLASDTPAPSPSDTPSSTPVPTSTGTDTATASPAPSLTPSATSFASRAVLISEVAWSGTQASASDEWIELTNAGDGRVCLEGWRLTDSGDVDIALHGCISAGAFFLLERTDDPTVSDVAAGQIFTGGLSNSGERLLLLDPSGAVIDTANGNAGEWPAGSGSPDYASMERTGGGPESDAMWCTNDAYHRSGHDAEGHPINGTPGMPFSGVCAVPTLTRTPTRTRTPSVTPSATPPGTASVTSTSTATDTVTATATSTLTLTASLSPTASPSSTAVAPHAAVINEVAWSGTSASSNDEWIELHNPGPSALDLSGWHLSDGNDVHIELQGVLAAGGYYLLERSDESTVSDIGADILYIGGLSNGGEQLRLSDASGNLVDTANPGGGAWPAGSSSPSYASMERASIASESGAAWASNTGWIRNGLDAAGNPIRGTPRRANSVLVATPTPTPVPGHVVINEFLPKTMRDWNDDGERDVDDEFIELYNAGLDAVDLGGWKLDDRLGAGSAAYLLPHGVILRPHEYRAFFRTKTKISLGESGDGVWLLGPRGEIVDGLEYGRARWADIAWGRFPNGGGNLLAGYHPTPGEPNYLPDDLLRPFLPQPLILAQGWREVDCPLDRGAPVIVEQGVLVAGGWEAWVAAEAWGWARRSRGGCEAWLETED